MKVNKVEWGKCPHCKVTLNGYQFYPADILMNGGYDFFSQYECANCKEKILVNCKVTLEFKVETE